MSMNNYLITFYNCLFVKKRFFMKGFFVKDFFGKGFFGKGFFGKNDLVLVHWSNHLNSNCTLGLEPPFHRETLWHRF